MQNKFVFLPFILQLIGAIIICSKESKLDIVGGRLKHDADDRSCLVDLNDGDKFLASLDFDLLWDSDLHAQLLIGHGLKAFGEFDLVTLKSACQDLMSTYIFFAEVELHIFLFFNFL